MINFCNNHGTIYYSKFNYNLVWKDYISVCFEQSFIKNIQQNLIYKKLCSVFILAYNVFNLKLPIVNNILWFLYSDIFLTRLLKTEQLVQLTKFSLNNILCSRNKFKLINLRSNLIFTIKALHFCWNLGRNNKRIIFLMILLV